jgi:ubiquinol-cytochrome c reductase cytochrome c1 subunit
MARLLAILVGLGFVFVAAVSFVTGLFTWFSAEEGEGSHAAYEHPRHFDFSFNGPFGQYNEQQLQRGFQVYKEVCSGCHSLNLVAFRNLHDLGYSEAEVRAIADQWAIQVPSVNPDTGEAATRKAIPSDHFPSPYPNETAARAANNNANPPDLSLIAKAREGGAAYIASLLTGYRQAPQGHEVPQGLHYNVYFSNLNIAMPPPLTADGQVTYADGTQPTRDQMAQDVAAFLTWSAEPNLERRHQMGIAVVLFLLGATVLAYFAYRNVWADRKVKKRKAQPVA